MTPPRILILTSSLLTDRMLRYGPCLGELARHGEVVVWSSGAGAPERLDLGGPAPVAIEPYPEAVEFGRFPTETLRRANDVLWDRRLALPSRVDQWTGGVRERRPSTRVVELAAPLVDRGANLERIERAVGRVMIREMAGSPMARRIDRLAPDLVVTMCPMWSLEAATAAAAMSVGVPVVAFMTSFDNLSTKRRIELPFDRWLLWSDEQRRQLGQYYPGFPSSAVDVVGAPQFDVFSDPSVARTRSEWWSSQGLDPGRAVIVHALGSPNFIREVPGAVTLAEMVDSGRFGDAQLLIRPHPIHDDARLASTFERFGDSVVVQTTMASGRSARERIQDHDAIVQWVNTFRHADVVVNLSSSVTVDAAMLDRPVISLNFDPHPDGRQQRLVRAINSTWPHFAPIARSGGVWMADDFDQVALAVDAYLADGSLHRAGRRRIAEFVCGFTDGRNGARLADAIVAAVPSHRRVTTHASTHSGSPTP